MGTYILINILTSPTSFPSFRTFPSLIILPLCIRQQGNFQVYTEHHYLNENTPLNFLLFVLASPFSCLKLNNLPLWRRLCNKKASYFSPFVHHKHAYTQHQTVKRKIKKESLKGKSLAVICPVRKFPLGIRTTLVNAPKDDDDYYYVDEEHLNEKHICMQRK